jgi:hypothetical protein
VFFGDVINIKENEMREWTPADAKPDAPDDSGEDDDAGAPAGGSGGSEMPNPDGDPAPGTGPTYPVYTSNGGGAIRPVENGPVFDVSGGSFSIGRVYNRSNGPGAIRPAEEGPIYDVGAFDMTNLDLSAIYNRPNGPGVINPAPDGVEELAPRGGTLPVGPGGDPTVMMQGLGRLGLG